MTRPSKIVGLVHPWIAYADELEAKLEAVTAECWSHLENLNSQDAKIDRLEAQVAELKDENAGLLAAIESIQADNDTLLEADDE